MTTTTKVVLDSWPVVEAAKGSRRANSAIESLLSEQTPIMNLVNCAEVYCAVALASGALEARKVVGHLRRNVEFDVLDQARIMQAGHLKSQYYIALGDGFAVATALHHDAELWTGDSELLFDGSPWRARDLRPEVLGGRRPTMKERTGKIGRRTPVAGRPADEPYVAVSGLMDFLDLSEN